MDGVFKLHTVKIPVRSLKQTFSLCPIGDLHHNTDMFDDKMFAHNVSKWSALENPIWLGMGDYGDFGSTSEREWIKKLHSASEDRLHKYLRAEAYGLVDLLQFTKEKGTWAGVIGGNHKSPVGVNEYVDDILCAELDTPYLGVMSLIKFQFCYKKKKPVDLLVLAHHGTGGGQTNGASVTKVEGMRAITFAHIYYMGHDHKKWLSETGYLYGNDKHAHVLSNSQYYGRTGSYPRAYQHNTRNWIVNGAMKPVPLGSIRHDIQLVDIGTKSKPKLAFDISGVSM